MRWESKVKYAELAPAHNWRFNDSGNFGGRSLLTPDQDTLAHYGVPGMRWGVKTKGYVKKGYDTLKRRQAILKMKRKAEAKAQYDEGYHRGQRVASNMYFIKSRTQDLLSRRDADKKESLVDRGINKGVDTVVKKTGLDKTARDMGFDKKAIESAKTKAKDFLKDLKNNKLDDLYEFLKTEDGQKKAQKVANFLGKGASRALGVGLKASPVIRRGTRATIKTAGKTVKGAGRMAVRSAKAGYKWLREGEPSGAQRIRNRANEARRFTSKYLNRGANVLEKGAQYAHKGAHAAQRNLDQLLKKRPGRRG